MPIYSYKCLGCARKLTAFRKIDHRDHVPKCTCPADLAVIRVLDAPAVRGDLPGYDCPITGKWIEGRRAHMENLKAHGCRVLESGENERASHQLQRENDELEDRIGDSAAEFASQLNGEDRVALEQALTGGLDIGFDRETGKLV